MNVNLLAERRIYAMPELAYRLALDPERFPPLFPGFGPIPALRRMALHGAPAVGTLRDVEDVDGVVMQERIDALEPDRRHAYTLSGLKPPLSLLVRRGAADWTFGICGEGVHVRWVYAFELTTPLAWPVAAPLLHVFMRTAMLRCLAAMAHVLETL